MARFLAGAAACFLLLTGAFLFWQSKAAENPSLPKAQAARLSGASLFNVSQPLVAPEASPKSREEKRFSRADKNKDGKIETEEVLGSRRKAFAKTIGKFQGADADRNGWLTAAEYATTAPPPPKKQRCGC